MVKIGSYDYQLSNNKNKKLMVVVDNKKIHFGDIRYQHYYDTTKLLNKKLNHNDEKRRRNYLRRSKGIKNKKGELTYKDPLSPNYHSIRVLW